MPQVKVSKDCTVEGQKVKAGQTVNCSNDTAKYLRKAGYCEAKKIEKK